MTLSESTLLHFVAYLTLSSLSCQIVWLYFSAVCHLQIILHGVGNYTNDELQSLQKHPMGKKPLLHLPTPPAILQMIFLPHSFRIALLWAVFLGFLDSCAQASLPAH